MKEKDNEMTKTCSASLKPNPFTTYRDPKTGRWVVVNGCGQNLLVGDLAARTLKGPAT